MVPKFRAWHITEEEIMHDIWFNWDDFDSYESLNEIFQDERLIFMQSTGLIDQNGAEIFEGDIVRIPADVWVGFFGGNSPFIGKIIRMEDREYGRLVIELTNSRKGDMAFLHESIAKQIEIIGNIYENPEALDV